MVGSVSFQFFAQAFCHLLIEVAVLICSFGFHFSTLAGKVFFFFFFSPPFSKHYIFPAYNFCEVVLNDLHALHAEFSALASAAESLSSWEFSHCRDISFMWDWIFVLEALHSFAFLPTVVGLFFAVSLQDSEGTHWRQHHQQHVLISFWPMGESINGHFQPLSTAGLSSSHHPRDL